MAPLGEQVHTLREPFSEVTRPGWTREPLFRGRRPGISDLTCHFSRLEPGCKPHDAIRHVEEELLVVLDGELDVHLEDAEAGGGFSHMRATRGAFVYYPAWIGHLIENTSDRPIVYAVVKWTADAREAGPRLGPHVISFLATPAAIRRSAPPGYTAQPLLDGETRHLRHLHTHLTTIGPGGGFEPHADPYDVLIVTLEGTVETIGRRVPRRSVIFIPAGTPHGMRNPLKSAAVYLVFELHPATPRR